MFEIEGGDDGCCGGNGDCGDACGSHKHDEMDVDEDEDEDHDHDDDDDDDESDNDEDNKSTESKSTAATSDDDESDDDDDTVYQVATSDLLEWIQEIHSLAWKSQRASLTQACNQSSVFLSKALLIADFTCLQAVLSVYMASMHDWLSNRQNKLAPAMFNDF